MTNCSTQLSDHPAHLVGLSYGGWVAMNQALRRARPGSPPSHCSTPPGSPGSTPASVVVGRPISSLASLTPMPMRRRLARWLDNPVMLQRELMTALWAGSRGYRMEPKFPGILTDGELRAIDVPVLAHRLLSRLTPAEQPWAAHAARPAVAMRPRQATARCQPDRRIDTTAISHAA